jgi:hypothetical protein
MRIAGLPIVCLVLLGAIAIKAGTAASRPSDIVRIPDQTTAGSVVPQDTLTKADKLEIAYVRTVVPVERKPRRASPRLLCFDNGEIFFGATNAILQDHWCVSHMPT